MKWQNKTKFEYRNFVAYKSMYDYELMYFEQFVVTFSSSGTVLEQYISLLTSSGCTWK